MEPYRKKYFEYFGFKFPKKWQIHHIDHDRENDDIGNLIALPDFLHRSYHFYESFYKGNEMWRLSMIGKFNYESGLKALKTMQLISYCSKKLKDFEINGCHNPKLELEIIYQHCKKEFENII